MTSTGHLSSRCSLPPWALASQDYQEDPCPLEIVGARESEARLFQLLERLEDTASRGATFHEYLVARFRLEQLSGAPSPATATLQHSYLRFLRGWGADSNAYSGAVLKNWVESRFGLRPTYHAGILASNEEAQAKYLRDRMRGEAETMGLYQQLDLLYTYCQYELQRRFPGERWRTLYRGTHDPEEYAVDRAQPHLVTLNNLSSFTSDREIAWEFGSLVWKVRIPVPKIVFFSGLLPRNILEGEKEYLVLGGRYTVEALKW
ncbi:MAG: dinitrogenase reductase [Fibrobacteres bacterium]|jgi:NAD+--dinitrogen-reductase ADP-D-ribosyltransferase|nr:dinitrogenase reductase [Fibrobacterota bacterium]